MKRLSAGRVTPSLYPSRGRRRIHSAPAKAWQTEPEISTPPAGEARRPDDGGSLHAPPPAGSTPRPLPSPLSWRQAHGAGADGRVGRGIDHAREHEPAGSRPASATGPARLPCDMAALPSLSVVFPMSVCRDREAL